MPWEDGAPLSVCLQQPFSGHTRGLAWETVGRGPASAQSPGGSGQVLPPGPPQMVVYAQDLGDGPPHGNVWEGLVRVVPSRWLCPWCYGGENHTEEMIRSSFPQSPSLPARVTPAAATTLCPSDTLPSTSAPQRPHWVWEGEGSGPGPGLESAPSVLTAHGPGTRLWELVTHQQVFIE